MVPTILYPPHHIFFPLFFSNNTWSKPSFTGWYLVLMTSFVTNIWIFPYYLYCTTWVYHPSNSPNVFLLRCSSLLCCDLRSWSISELFSGLKLIHIIYIANKFIFQLSIFVFMRFCRLELQIRCFSQILHAFIYIYIIFLYKYIWQNIKQ